MDSRRNERIPGFSLSLSDGNEGFQFLTSNTPTDFHSAIQDERLGEIHICSFMYNNEGTMIYFFLEFLITDPHYHH